MAAKIYLIFIYMFFLFLLGCQPKSEIDKCVDAITLKNYSTVPETRSKENPDFDRKDCLKQDSVRFGADYRLQCLRAQAGKN
jgi:hypothetical protein